jgi:hypothetical protein
MIEWWGKGPYPSVLEDVLRPQQNTTYSSICECTDLQPPPMSMVHVYTTGMFRSQVNTRSRHTVPVVPTVV